MPSFYALLKTEKRDFDITADLHYEGQQFNATADVSELNPQLIGSSLTEAYSRNVEELATTRTRNLSADRVCMSSRFRNGFVCAGPRRPHTCTDTNRCLDEMKKTRATRYKICAS
jgi:hypothetical protein